MVKSSDPEAIESLPLPAATPSAAPKSSVEASAQKSTSAFSRKAHDRRLVRHVVGVQHQPTNWITMDIQSFECKLMEIRKYSADYYDIEAKFRKPDLELISCYSVQNPFLYGNFKLRKEQLGMQLDRTGYGVKEQLLYAPISFSELSLVLRNNFFALTSLEGQDRNNKFYANSEKANQIFTQRYGGLNPRLMVMVRVLVGATCDLGVEPTESSEAVVKAIAKDKSIRVPYFTVDGHMVDTVIDEENVVIKMHPNDVYPAHVLVYRDRKGESDSKVSRLESVLGPRCQLSYRAGTRFNPQEKPFFKPSKAMDAGIDSKSNDDARPAQKSTSKTLSESTGAIPKQTKKIHKQ